MTCYVKNTDTLPTYKMVKKTADFNGTAAGRRFDFVQLKFNLLCGWVLFQNANSPLNFRIISTLR